jgi:V/A-type H+-transporting ATPase subunit G/H
LAIKYDLIHRHINRQLTENRPDRVKTYSEGYLFHRDKDNCLIALFPLCYNVNRVHLPCCSGNQHTEEVVMFLAIEALRAVRETEVSAVELRRSTRAEARKIRERAEAEGEAIVAKAVAEARREAAELLARAEAEAAEEAKPIHQEAEAVSARIGEEAKQRLPEAVALIVERIVKANGRS